LNALLSLVAKTLASVINSWLRRIGLRKQGATEQRERNRKETSEKIAKAMEATRAVEPDSTDGVRDSDYRD